MKERIIWFFIILFIPQAFAYTDVTTDEVIKWALSTQKPDGSFTMIPSSNWVQPFFDNHLAI